MGNICICSNIVQYGNIHSHHILIDTYYVFLWIFNCSYGYFDDHNVQKYNFDWNHDRFKHGLYTGQKTNNADQSDFHLVQAKKTNIVELTIVYLAFHSYLSLVHRSTSNYHLKKQLNRVAIKTIWTNYHLKKHTEKVAQYGRAG